MIGKGRAQETETSPIRLKACVIPHHMNVQYVQVQS